MKGRYRVILPDGSYVSHRKWTVADLDPTGALVLRDVATPREEDHADARRFTGAYRIFAPGTWAEVAWWPMGGAA